MANGKGKAKLAKFKDSPLFGIIKNLAPDLLDGATDLVATAFPALAPINNLVDKALDRCKEKGNSNGIAQLTEARDSYMSQLELYYKDMDSARDMYQDTEHEMADSIADNVIKRNLIFVAVLIVVQVLVVMYVEDKVLIAVISGAIGSVTTALLQERQQVINFFFGSSKGSKSKDKK